MHDFQMLMMMMIVAVLVLEASKQLRWFRKLVNTSKSWKAKPPSGNVTVSKLTSSKIKAVSTPRRRELTTPVTPTRPSNVKPRRLSARATRQP